MIKPISVSAVWRTDDNFAVSADDNQHNLSVINPQLVGNIRDKSIGQP